MFSMFLAFLFKSAVYTELDMVTLASAWGRMRFEDCHEFKARLGYRMCMRPSEDLQKDVSQKTRTGETEIAQWTEAATTLPNGPASSPALSRCVCQKQASVLRSCFSTNSSTSCPSTFMRVWWPAWAPLPPTYTRIHAHAHEHVSKCRNAIKITGMVLCD